MPTFKPQRISEAILRTRFAEVETQCDKPAYPPALKSGGLRAGPKMRSIETREVSSDFPCLL
jgi:hypothetical protein